MRSRRGTDTLINAAPLVGVALLVVVAIGELLMKGTLAATKRYVDEISYC